MKPVYTALLFVLSLILTLTALVAHDANQPPTSPPEGAKTPAAPTTEHKPAPPKAPEARPEPPLLERIQGTWGLDHTIDGEQVHHQLGAFRDIRATFAPGGGLTLRLPKTLGGTGQSITASTRVLQADEDTVRMEVMELEVAHGQAPPKLFPAAQAGGMQVDVSIEDDLLTVEVVGNSKSLVFKRSGV